MVSWSAAGAGAGLSSKMCNKDNYSGPLPPVSSEGFWVAGLLKLLVSLFMLTWIPNISKHV